MSDIQQTIIDIVTEQALLEPGDVTTDSTLEELNLDSIAMVEVIFALEEAFNIHIPFNANNPDESAFDITSVATIISAVEGLIKDQS